MGRKTSQIFRTVGERSLTNYNYVDVAAGTGTVIFNGFASEDSVGYGYHLSSSEPTSAYVEGSSASYTINTSAFNLPQTIRGTGWLGFSWAFVTVGAATAYITCTVAAVSGGVPTTIASGTTATITHGGAATTIKRALLDLSFTETIIKAGDSIRLTMAITASAGTVYLAFDPAGRDGTVITPAATYPTELQLEIPFKLDLI